MHVKKHFVDIHFCVVYLVMAAFKSKLVRSLNLDNRKYAKIFFKHTFVPKPKVQELNNTFATF